MTTIPRQNDILFGKGNSINSHHGNKNLRSTVELQRENFRQSEKRTQKRNIAKVIIQNIENSGGRFLMEDPNSSRRNIKENGGGGQKNNETDTTNASACSNNIIVTDPFILAKVWVHVDQDKALKKVMHRLRGKQGSEDKKQPTREPHISQLKRPPDTTVSKVAEVGTVGGIESGIQLGATGSTKGIKLAKVVSNILGHYGPDKFATQSTSAAVAKIAKVDTKGWMMNESQLNATTCSHTDIKAKMASKILEHDKPKKVAVLGDSVRHISQSASAAVSTCQSVMPSQISIQSTFGLTAGRKPNMNGGVQNACVPLSISQWIQSKLFLARGDYVKSAVDISWKLTKHLIQLVADAEITLSDIAVEKVIILVENTLSTLPGVAFVVQDIQFASSIAQGQNCHSKWSPLSSCAVCASLGNILLEIFSIGRCSELKNSCATSNDLEHCTMGSILSVTPPAQKRRLLLTGTSIRSRANDLLVDMGMPVSISQLVSDLLDAIKEPCPNTALTSLEEALWDLTQMKECAQTFLIDRTCPTKALADTCLFVNTDRHMFGREAELESLMSAKRRIAEHVKGSKHLSDSEDMAFRNGSKFLCETIFLSGYAGSGKSTLLRPLINSCTDEGWLVFSLKFDGHYHTAPHAVAAKVRNQCDRVYLLNEFKNMYLISVSQAIDDFFRKCNPSMLGTVAKVVQSILSTIGREGFDYLSELIPSLSLSPLLPQNFTPGRKSTTPASIDKLGSVGSAHERRKYLFQVVGNAICSAGIPILCCLDDLQWSKTYTLDLLAEFIDSQHDIGQPTAPRSGVFILGTFRTNEVNAENLFGRINNDLKLSKKISPIKLTINDLTKDDIAMLLGIKLCLPLRYCQELARVIHFKTIGNPFYIMQFMKTILENRMLEFSVSARSWIWDCDVIHMQMISKGVAELLTIRLNRLPLPLIQTLKLVSCFGYEVESSTIRFLNSGLQLPYNMGDALHLAINEGLMDKAGPLYAFTHDLIQEAIYELIPVDSRNSVHKSIGTILLQCVANNPSLYLLAVDQMNLSCKDAVIGPEECANIAKINATAAKFAVAASSFEHARSYIDKGMKMLDANHWEKQYPLSLELFEIDATVSCMHGDINTMSSCLNTIMANVKSFEDSLTSSSLLVKLLSASSRYDEAMGNCLSVLSNLGEEIPTEVSLPLVMNELAVIETTLANISVANVKLLSHMRDKTKLSTMKFLNMLCKICLIAKPMLVPIISCRMVRLTIEHGFCDDSIVGLATAACALKFSLCEDIVLAYRIGKVCDELIEESPNKHALRSRLVRELDITLVAMVEPRQHTASRLPNRHKSAMLVGDIGSAMQCLLAHCACRLYTGAELSSLSESFVACIEQSVKYEQHDICHLAMSTFRPCIHLRGRENDAIVIKSYEELDQIGKSSNSNFLLERNFMSKQIEFFFDRDYTKVMNLSEKLPPINRKDPLMVTRLMYEGVASLTLARQTNQVKWRNKGEDCLEKLSKWLGISEWNFAHNFYLVQAEWSYLNGNLNAAEAAYNASILSAHNHHFLHEEALAYELYSIFCFQNQMIDIGVEQLRMALEKYKQWGAIKKVGKLQLLMEMDYPPLLHKLMVTV